MIQGVWALSKDIQKPGCFAPDHPGINATARQ